MPKPRHSLASALVVMAMLALSFLAGCKRRPPSVCPSGMLDVPARGEPGKSLWCQTADKSRAQWIEWHPNSTQLRQSCGYRDDKPEGSFTAWHLDGKPWVQGQYTGGQKFGKWKQWDSAGSEVAEGEYGNGRLIAGAPVASIASCEKAAKP